ncbi:thymidine phosphorylase [Paracoccus sp. SCSIO 75233]|uniref:thymidine phosphorylase n=1 Tax=Paracoccus sp. SCSIO 75233 TaxID=3017782 RepID=UPI0022F142CD|nr:thymidine phosphorylase [Paracoccus sp. SCSIO 75233]WBU52527.1 thymidine phosphorylase [Paracoccus sp. SCSIO 75233]
MTSRAADAGQGRVDPRPVIARLREGNGLDQDGARVIAQGLADGSVSDAQAAAFAMAVLLRGLSAEGRTALTAAMRDSGDVLHWDLPGPVVDKHSTGGIGDTVSLVLAPVLAACGAYVPMISGRGLGHTGGTLDKLEAIPGFNCDLSEAAFRRQVREIGCAIVSATADLAPADRRLYAIRDEAACVPSVDLITASILSKKLAAGLDALVMDVKSGSGAFLGSAEEVQDLARSLVATANAAGCRTSAMISDMDQPLARAAGNGLEVREAIAALRGAPSALRDLSLSLAAEVLALVGEEQPLTKVTAALESGHAAEVFARMVAAQGGPADVLDNPDQHLPTAPVIRPIPVPEGYVAQIDAAALGQAVIALGGGRVRAGDAIDHRVGLSGLRRLGEPTEGQIGLVHARTEADADGAIAAVLAAYRITEQPVDPGPLIRDHIKAPAKQGADKIEAGE